MKRIGIRNRYESTTPLIVHANGMAESRIWQFIRNQFFQTAGKFSPVCDHGQQKTSDITVVTWNNTGKPGVFERSCGVLGVPVRTVSADVRTLSPNTRITYPIKIEATTEALWHVKTKYTMMADSFDAILLDSPVKALDIFKEMNGVKMVIGAERGHFPAELNTAKSEEQFSWSIDRPYINSGFVFGETDFIREFYAKAKECGDNWNEPCLRTDQAVIKKVISNDPHTSIYIDHDCKFCQNLFRVKPGELELFYIDNAIRLETV